MRNKTLVKLFLVDFVIFLTGMGLLPLLPIFAERFGADAGDAGVYLAITYAAITSGTLLTDRLARWAGYRNLFIAAGSLGVPALILLGQAAQFWQLVALTAAIWFSGGIGLALVNVFTGLFADEKSRGKSFSLTFLSLPLASFFGGIAVGGLAEWRGYPFMFTMLALAWAAWPIVAIAGMGGWPLPRLSDKGQMSDRSWVGLGRPFVFLLVATLMSATTVYLLRLGTTYAMHAQSYSASAISGTAAVGGLSTIPLTYAVGTLTDKFGRRQFLMAGSLLGGLGGIVLANAGQLWHFWLAIALVYMSLNIIGAIAPALAADLLPLEMRGRGLPVLSSMRNIAGIIGFAVGGLLIEKAGIFNLYLIAVFLSVSAATLMGQVSATGRPSIANLESKATPSQRKNDLSTAPVN